MLVLLASSVVEVRSDEVRLVLLQLQRLVRRMAWRILRGEISKQRSAEIASCIFRPRDLGYRSACSAE